MSTDARKSAGWKDSNWYVSLSGFWRQYKKHRIGILGIILLALYVGMAVGAPWIATHDPSPTAKVAPNYLAPQWVSVFNPEGVVTGEFMRDIGFNDTDTWMIDPEASVSYKNGSNQDEFDYLYQEANGGNDFNHVNLTWTHANESMDWRTPPDPDDNLPAANDFIYFTQQLEWPYESIPSDVNMTLDFAITRTGDFAKLEGGLMFKVYVWVIDSSGNWRNVYRSYPLYSDTYRARQIDLSYLHIVDGWRGMVENATGHQEDPTDILTVAVGLVPTAVFRNFLGDTPEYNYTGSVTASFRSISMIAYGEYFGLLGTTDKGADAFSQLIYGSRISLTIGILATAIATAIGVVVGLTAGYFGGKTDEILMRVVDFLLVIPGLPLMMIMASFLGPKTENIIIVISILGWTGTSRLIRSQVMAEKNKAYVESARAIGASDTYIIIRHILPNVTPILFANITLGVVGAILSESGLAFLGLTDPSQPSWGRMLADAQGTGGFTHGAWWVVVFPGLMITILSLSFTFVGHTLDQVLNPRLRER